MPTQNTIPARHGVATHLSAGKTIKIINTYGSQIVDTWAFTVSPSSEIISQMSMQHTRAYITKTIPKVGDVLYDNERNKMFTLTEDTTTNGYHDTLIAACDRQRYEQLGVKDHRNCADNLVEGLEGLGQ
jgi:uncharacterized protein YcgI (DUF1989 family)